MVATRLQQSRSAGQNSLPGPDDIHRVVLSNGITVLSRPNFNSPSVVVSGYFASGSLFETDDKLGLADFVCTSLMRGTAKRDMQSIYGALETAGATLGYDSGTFDSNFSGRALAEDLSLVLDVLAETLQFPAFPIEHVERLRAQMLAGLAIRAQDTADMADIIFDQIVFEGHPFGRPDDGWPETIAAITRDDMLDFHRRTFGPQNFVIAVVGGIDPQAAADKVQAALGDWKNKNQIARAEIPDAPVLKKTVKRHHAIEGKTQTDIVLGTSGPRRKEPDYLAASLGNSVLGQFGMMGRIGDVVREKAGLAYHASSSVSGGIGPGTWDVTAGVSSKNTKRAVDLILKEIEKFVAKGVTAKELEDSKANFIGRLPLSLESNGGVAGSILNMERYDLGFDHLRNYAQKVNAVKREDVLAAARKYLNPSALVVATSGP